MHKHADFSTYAIFHGIVSNMAKNAPYTYHYKKRFVYGSQGVNLVRGGKALRVAFVMKLAAGKVQRSGKVDSPVSIQIVMSRSISHSCKANIQRKLFLKRNFEIDSPR